MAGPRPSGCAANHGSSPPPCWVESFLSSFSTRKIGSQGVDRVATHGISREGLNQAGLLGAELVFRLARWGVMSGGATLGPCGVSRRPHTMLRAGRSPRKCPESLVGRQGEQAQLASKPWTLGLKERFAA